MKKLPNLYIKKRQGYESYYFRYKINGIPQPQIPLGNSKATPKAQVRARYYDAQNRAYNIRHGLEPIQAEETKSQRPILLTEIWNDWVIHEQNRSKGWSKGLHNIKHFVIFFGSESDWIVKEKRPSKDCKLDLAELTTKDINNFYVDQYDQLINGEPIKNETVAKRHNYLNPLYTYLTNEKILLDNYYARKGKLKNPKDTSVPHQVLTREQAESIVDNAPNEYCHRLWSIMLDTAMAPKDARKLTYKDNYFLGKTSSGETYPCIITKRAKSGEISAMEMFPRLLALGENVWNLGGKKSDTDDANREFQKVVKKLGIEREEGKRLTQYCFRHSLATHLITDKLWSLDRVKRSLGHAIGSDVTERYIANQIGSDIQTDNHKKERIA